MSKNRKNVNVKKVGANGSLNFNLISWWMK